jgi:transcription initiation factor TFIIB
MGERIGLSKIVIDSAKQIFKKVEEEKILKTKTNDVIVATCIFIACRQHHVTRTFKEICALTKVSKKEIGRCFKIVHPILEVPTEEVTMDSYINRFASFLDFPSDLQKAASKIATNATQLGILAGKSPITVCAGCLYFVAEMVKHEKPAKEIADIAGCTEATLKNAYKILYDNRDDILKGVELADKIEKIPTP